MPAVTYQTIRLSKGKHSSPEHGACVMELASMLAGEAFSDHPKSVSPAIGAFLRGYNDLIDDPRRRGLYAYAAKVVGTTACASVERARAQRLLEWGDELNRSRRFRCFLPWARRPRAFGDRGVSPEAAGMYAVRAVKPDSARAHRDALALIDELIVMMNASPASSMPTDDPVATSTTCVPGRIHQEANGNR